MCFSKLIHEPCCGLLLRSRQIFLVPLAVGLGEVHSVVYKTFENQQVIRWLLTARLESVFWLIFSADVLVLSGLFVCMHVCHNSEPCKMVELIEMPFRLCRCTHRRSKEPNIRWRHRSFNEQGQFEGTCTMQPTPIRSDSKDRQFLPI